MTVNTIIRDDMPIGIYESVTQNPDGSYTIFINAKYDMQTQQQAYLHALHHIENKDFERTNVQEIEYNAKSNEDTFRQMEMPSSRSLRSSQW